jgi:predicted  nucleic acid-binding Zn-ribbon protein|tara:strand:+ start:1532 stop:1744 length:213 start_codon:yes stop_codon:yes gene_type:complete
MNIKDEIEGVARHLRIVCSQQIEDLEDQLPQVTNPVEREDLQKRIDTLHEMTDEVNRRAEVLIQEYNNKT